MTRHDNSRCTDAIGGVPCKPARRHTPMRAGIALLALGLGTLPALPAAAQDDARVRKLEAEVRALQRKVFPGADGRYFEPEVNTAPGAAPASGAAPSTTAVTDILARLDALEGQLARLTAQTEQNTNSLAELDTRLGNLEANAASASATSAAAAVAAAPPPANAGTTATPARPSAAATPAPAPSARPSAERVAAVQAILKPQTGDPGEDEYTYGFRLWEANFYPEAAQQLQMYVEQYPGHRQISYGRNLLGRAYLDDGKAKEAAPWFLQNYQADKAGARAGDSLLFLAESMIALNDTKRACIALAEFGDTYPALATGRLASQYQADRRKVTCN